jgi:hypothetical protein
MKIGRAAHTGLPLGHVTIERSGSWIYLFGGARIEINDVRVATLYKNGVYETDLEPGETRVSADMFSVPGRSTLTFMAQAGVRYRLLVDPRVEVKNFIVQSMFPSVFGLAYGIFTELRTKKHEEDIFFASFALTLVECVD